MGASPSAVLLSLSLSEATQGEWIEGFMRGFYEGCELVWLDNGAPAEIELKGFTHF